MVAEFVSGTDEVLEAGDPIRGAILPLIEAIFVATALRVPCCLSISVETPSPAFRKCR